MRAGGGVNNVRADGERWLGLGRRGDGGLGIARPNPGLPDANLAFDRKAKARFWQKVSPAPSHECWMWRGAVGKSGYGNVGRNKITYLAHRLGYEFTYGPTPSGLDLDHLCRVKLCVNPVHLEPVTFLENMRRRYELNPDPRPTYCIRGHEYTPENTSVISTTGQRKCVRCYGGKPLRASESAPAAAPVSPPENEVPGPSTPELPAQRVMRRLRELQTAALTWTGPAKWEDS